MLWITQFIVVVLVLFPLSHQHQKQESYCNKDSCIERPNFSSKELASLRSFIPIGLLKDTGFGQILKGDRVPSLSLMQQLDPLVLERELIDNEEYIQRFSQFVEGYFYELDTEKLGEIEQEVIEEAPETLEDGGQVGGYEGCKRDYDTLSFPLVTSMFYNMLVRIPICESLGLPEATRLPFCECTTEGPPETWGCVTNTTYIPQPTEMNMTDWGRQSEFARKAVRY